MDRLGMYPELVDETDGLHHQHDDGMEAYHGHPGPEEKGARQIACPGLPQGCGQVIAFGGMMDYMRGPKPVDMVAGPMEPVIGEVICEKGQGPVPPMASVQRKNAQAVEKGEQSEDQGFCDETCGYIADAQGQAAESVFCLVEIPLLPIRKPGLQAK